MVVTVEHGGVAAHRMQPLFHQVGQRGLARARQAREPQDGGLVAFDGRTRSAVHFLRLRLDVVRSAQRKVQHAGGHRVEADAVDQDQAAGVAVAGVGVESHGLVQRQVAHANVVEVQPARCQLRLGGHIQAVLQISDRGHHCARGDLQQEASSRQHRRVGHPDQRAFKLVSHFGCGIGCSQHVAATDIDVVLQRQRHRFAGHGARAVAVQRDQTGDTTFQSRGQHTNSVAVCTVPLASRPQ